MGMQFDTSTPQTSRNQYTLKVDPNALTDRFFFLSSDATYLVIENPYITFTLMRSGFPQSSSLQEQKTSRLGGKKEALCPPPRAQLRLLSQS